MGGCTYHCFLQPKSHMWQFTIFALKDTYEWVMTVGGRIRVTGSAIYCINCTTIKWCWWCGQWYGCFYMQVHWKFDVGMTKLVWMRICHLDTTISHKYVGSFLHTQPINHVWLSFLTFLLLWQGNSWTDQWGWDCNCSYTARYGIVHTLLGMTPWVMVNRRSRLPHQPISYID